MKKLLMLTTLLVLIASCGTTNKVTNHGNLQCKRDSKVICEKPHAPVLEAMNDNEISANVKYFGAAYKNNNHLIFQKTKTSELQQCIAVYQYYNCKAFCESDTLTKADKAIIDRQIISDCRNEFLDREKQKMIAKGALKTNGTRILIKIEAKNYKVSDNLRDFIQSAFEKGATQFENKTYIIVSDKDRIQMMERIKKEYNMQGNDPDFLPAINKLLSPDVIVEIKVSYMGKRLMLKNSLLIVKTGARIKTDYREYEIKEGNDVEYDIFKSFEKLAPEFLKLIK